jgi:RNA polymerase sigma-70 factor (ECF subfamily)
LEDRLLVQKLLAKDEEAELYFFRTYREKIYKVCVYILGYQDPEAEDLTQETFLIALQKLHQFEFRSSLYTWLYRVCVHLCYGRVNLRERQVAHLQEDLEFLAGPLSVSRQRKEEEDGEKKKRLELLLTQKGLMGEPCRSLLDLRDMEGKSYAEISENLKVPMGTVMSRLARCRETLKQLVIRALKGKKDG